VVAWEGDHDVRFLLAGLLLPLIPCTLVVLLSTNEKLLDPSLDASSPKAAAVPRSGFHRSFHDKNLQ
jgi:hypothetical protein